MAGGGVLFSCHGNSNLSTESLGAKLNRGRGSWPSVTAAVATFRQFSAGRKTQEATTHLKVAGVLRAPENIPMGRRARGPPALSQLGLAGIPFKHWGRYTGSAHWEPHH